MSTQSQDGEPEYSVDVTKLDGECRDVLRVIWENDGEATTTEIRHQGAVDRGRLHYRYEKLEAAGLISTYTAIPEDGGQEVKHASLTDSGRAAIQDGLLEDITDANTSLKQLRRQIDDLRTRLDHKADANRVEPRLAVLAENVEELSEAVEQLDVRDDLADLRSRVRETERATSTTAEDVAEVETAIGAVESELAESVSEARLARSLDAINKRLGQVVEHLEAEVSRLDDRLDELEAEVEGKASRGEVRRLAEQMDEQDLREGFDNLMDRVYRLEQKRGERERRVDEKLREFENEVDKIRQGQSKIRDEIGYWE